jgi:hypothetical protein
VYFAILVPPYFVVTAEALHHILRKSTGELIAGQFKGTPHNFLLIAKIFKNFTGRSPVEA